MDSTSFASVLAGVKRMREQYDDKDHTDINERQMTENEESKIDKEEGLSSQLEYKRLKTGDSETKHSGQKQMEPSQTSNEEFRSSELPSVPQSGAEPQRDKARTAAIRDKIRANVQMYSQIQVSPSQKGNPVFQSPILKTKPIAYNKEILSDYYINPTLQILFLSLKYHQLHPEYVWRRCRKLNQGSMVSSTRDKALKVLLVVIDIENPQDNLRKLNNICIKQDLTLLVAWSFEQAGTYIALLKENELAYNKVNLSIKGVVQTDYKSTLNNCLTNIKSINKTDVINLMTEVGSFKDIVENSNDIKINGFGDRKIQNLHQAFKDPFIYNKD